MIAGNRYRVRVKMLNSGKTPWTEGDGFRLGSQDPTDNARWGMGRVPLQKGETVVPGQEKIFDFFVKAPPGTGPQSFQWRMVQDGTAGWFGDPTARETVQVRAVPVKEELLWDENYYSITQPSDFLSQHGDPFPGARRRVSQDTSITKITIDVTDMPPGSWVETCLYVQRDASPFYPSAIGGYSEILGWHAMHHVTENDWHRVIDLSETPLFLPKDSTIRCLSRLARVNPRTMTPADAENVRFRCSMETKPYIAGEPRYRILRLPYNDQTLDTEPHLATSYYVSSRSFPLHVKGAFLFQSFGADPTPATASDVCLKWVRQGGGNR